MKIRSFTVGPVATQCYLIINQADNTAFITDPGDDAEMLLRAIDEEKARLKYVILTHGHFDHVMAVGEILKNTGAKLVVHEDEVPALSDGVLSGCASFGVAMQDTLKEDIAVKDGDTLDFGGTYLEFMHTPGHTVGSMCILLGDIILTGDTLFAGTCGRCDLPGGDYEMMLKSLKRLAELKGNFKIYPGHGEPSAIDIERKYNPYMREALRG